MATSAGRKESLWNEPFEVAFGPDLARTEEVLVRWRGADFEAEATIVNHHGSPVVKSFWCAGVGGPVPGRVRRLPSDAVVIRAVLRKGAEGAGPLINLLGEQREFLSWYERVDGEGPDYLEALEQHGRLIARRPRAAIQQQVREARTLLSEGLGAAEIERELNRRFGISQRTAYRRIGEAKKSLTSERGDKNGK